MYANASTKYAYFFFFFSNVKLCIGIKYKVCWLRILTRRHIDVITYSILFNLDINLPRACLSEIPNFILIGHKRAEIKRREVSRES